jgi:hypothetical protein
MSPPMRLYTSRWKNSDERCDKEAISHLAKALDQAGYRREAAVAQVNFSSQ